MAEGPTDRQKQAFVDVLRDMLVKGESVAIPRLGTFDVRHSPSEIEDQEDGHTIIHPPRDFVHFEPKS